MAERNRRIREPITSHPLFPAIVVLWFAALFGAASLAIRPELIERLVLATGIDGVIPMAAPPLGTTTRILLALMMSVLGCLAGLLVARRFARSRPSTTPGARRRRSAPSAGESDSPVSLFGGARRDDQAASAEDEDEPEVDVLPLRRRQLAIDPDRSAPPEERAPLPGNQILNVGDLDLESFDAAIEPDPWVRRPAPDTLAVDMPEQAAVSPTQPPLSGSTLFETYARGVPESEPVAGPGFALFTPADASAPAAATTVQDAPAPPEPLAEQEVLRRASAAERIATTPLDALSPVELLERLALAIERRRRAAAARAEQAASEMPPQSDPAEMPAGLRPLSLDLGEASDEALSVTIPPRHMGLAATPTAEGEEDVVLAQGYSSLRGLTKPAARPPFLRFDALGGEPLPPIEAPQTDLPAPSEADAPRAFDPPRSDTGNTDAALRAALATLQRMSGAA